MGKDENRVPGWNKKGKYILGYERRNWNEMTGHKSL
jgi:hypothetical protein